jgi:hypothetical protein
MDTRPDRGRLRPFDPELIEWRHLAREVSFDVEIFLIGSAVIIFRNVVTNDHRAPVQECIPYRLERGGGDPNVTLMQQDRINRGGLFARRPNAVSQPDQWRTHTIRTSTVANIAALRSLVVNVKTKLALLIPQDVLQQQHNEIAPDERPIDRSKTMNSERGTMSSRHNSTPYDL